MRGEQNKDSPPPRDEPELPPNRPHDPIEPDPMNPKPSPAATEPQASEPPKEKWDWAEHED